MAPQNGRSDPETGAHLTENGGASPFLVDVEKLAEINEVSHFLALYIPFHISNSQPKIHLHFRNSHDLC